MQNLVIENKGTQIRGMDRMPDSTGSRGDGGVQVWQQIGVYRAKRRSEKPVMEEDRSVGL